MDKLTNIVRDEISRQYKSVRQFAFAVGIPLSTINSALHNGIGGSSLTRWSRSAAPWASALWARRTST